MSWRRIALAVGVLLIGYLLAWPTPVEPAAWAPPSDPGYQGAFAPNQGLAALERLPLGGLTGPEDLALDRRGRLYAATHEGKIVRMDPDGTRPTVLADTGGRPLGVEVGADGTIYVADAYRGLLAVTSSGAVSTLVDSVDGQPLVYADNLAVTRDGQRIYFSDASTKFGAEANGGTFAASKLDIFEHGGHGRILVYDKSSGETEVLQSGLQFANGVALSEDETRLVVAETGMYRVLVIHLAGPKAGEMEVLIDNLPGFPDNVERGPDGTFWVGLVSARSKPLDGMASHPFIRKVVMRLPAAARPDAVAYGHVFAIDLDGKVQADLQDPSGAYAKTTGAISSGPWLFISSLTEPDLGRLRWSPR